MENQHRKIKGYRELSQDEIDLMNRIKEQGVALGALVEDLRVRQFDQDRASPTEASADPHAWINAGEMDLKRGLMALTRAVAKPEFF